MCFPLFLTSRNMVACEICSGCNLVTCEFFSGRDMDIMFGRNLLLSNKNWINGRHSLEKKWRAYCENCSWTIIKSDSCPTTQTKTPIAELLHLKKRCNSILPKWTKAVFTMDPSKVMEHSMWILGKKKKKIHRVFSFLEKLHIFKAWIFKFETFKIWSFQNWSYKFWTAEKRNTKIRIAGTFPKLEVSYFAISQN